MANGNSAAETYGWDTVFAIPIPSVNEAIVNHRSSPSGFTYSDSEIDASATFGDWQIVQGGSGKAIYLSLPLQSITLAIHSTGKHLALPTGTAVIEVQLQYVAQSGANAGDGQG